MMFGTFEGETEKASIDLEGNVAVCRPKP